MIDLVLVGNIARSGKEILPKYLKTPHRLTAYPCELSNAEVLIGSPVTAAMIQSAPKLRLVHASGAGCDSIAMDALPDHVVLCNVYHHERAIAEYVMMTMLAMDRNLFGQDRNLRSGVWDGSCVTGDPQASELIGKTVGMLGYGHIGKEVARLAGAFEMTISSVRSGHSRKDLELVLATADYFVVACTLSDRTRGAIGAAELALMKPSAALINIARGEIVDEQALYEALRDRRIRSAAIDVWYCYPDGDGPVLPSRFPFHLLDNVILTPHSSAWTHRVVELRFRDIAANIDRLVAGEPLQKLVSRN